MQIRVVAILALCATQLHPSFAGRIFDVWNYATYQPLDRLLTLMRNIYATGENRVKQLMHDRAKHETTLEFEMGYVMGEIIERYRQMVLHIKNSIKFKNYNLYDKLMRLEFVQHLHFEIYHLGRMVHELPRKFGHKVGELVSGTHGASNDNSTLVEAMAGLPAREQEREREKRQKIRDMQAEHHIMNHNFNGTPTAYTAKPKTHYWPIDYGWSIESW